MALQDLRRQRGISQKQIAEGMGIDETNFSAMVNGRRPGASNIIEYLNKHYGYSIENGNNDNVPVVETELKMLPEVSFSFAAGQKQLVNGKENVNRHWYLPDCTDCDAVVPIEGDSMSPNIPPGSFAVLKRFHITANNPNSIPFGQVFGIVVEDEATGDYHGYVKVLRKHKDAEQAKQCWIAHSYNTDYDDFDIHLSQVRSLWIVKQYVVSSMAY